MLNRALSEYKAKLTMGKKVKMTLRGSSKDERQRKGLREMWHVKNSKETTSRISNNKKNTRVTRLICLSNAAAEERLVRGK